MGRARLRDWIHGAAHGGEAVNIVFGFPPIYERAAALFPIKGREVYFAWGDTVYVTNSRKAPSDAIMAHERVHSEQQATAPAGALQSSIETWWAFYLNDPAFRLSQELPAHAAELAHRLRNASGRNDRRRLVSIVSHKLAAPMYGGLISKERAKDELLKLVERIPQPMAM